MRSRSHEDVDDLVSRSGRQPGRGYVHEVDAVCWELLEEAIKLFVDEVVRRRRLGLDDAAQRFAQGVLGGLDEVRRTAGEATVFRGDRLTMPPQS